MTDFRIFYTIIRDNIAEDHTCVLSAETPDDAIALIKAQAQTGQTIIIKKVKVAK